MSGWEEIIHACLCLVCLHQYHTCLKRVHHEYRIPPCEKIPSSNATKSIVIAMMLLSFLVQERVGEVKPCGLLPGSPARSPAVQRVAYCSSRHCLGSQKCHQ